MRFSLVFLSLLSCLLGSVVNVDAHAKLVSPMPWNPQPTKQQVCGVGAAAAVPARYVVSQVNAANPLVVQWQIVVADGRGPLTARLDTTAKTNPTMADFTVTLQTTPGTQNNPQRVSNVPYKISFQIPAGTVCTGPGGTCTLRVASTSNWVACATIKLMAAGGAGGAGSATPAPTIAPPPATATEAPADQSAMPVPTAPAPLFPTPTGSNGKGGALGPSRVLATQSQSGLEYMIAANPPQVAGRPQGVLLFLHGSTASNYQRGIQMFAQVAQQNDFIQLSVLAPNGQGWNEGGFNAQVTAANMLATLVTKDLLPAYNIDMAKVFFTGQSSGAGFLSQFFIPLQAKNMPGGGAFLQCGAAPPAVQFTPTAALIQNFKLHFEITSGDPIWPASYARAIQAYTAAGMSFTMLNTKPGGHCAFSQQQVVIDRLPAMLPKPVNNLVIAGFATQDASGDTFVVFSASAATTTRCVVAQGLKSCPKVNGQSVQLLTTSDLMMVDTAAENAITFGLNNTDIITTTPSVECQQAYRDMICASHFIPCGETVATTCKASCRTANQVCSFNQTMIEGDVAHASLYDCEKDTYQQLYADANGVCADSPGALPASTGNTGSINGAMSYAQPMLLITFISLFAKLFH